MDIRPKKLLAGLLALIMVLGMLPTSVFAAEADDGVVIIDNTATTVTTLDELKEALADGGNVTLGADITGPVDVTISKDTVLDLGGKTVTDAYIKIAANVTVQNGSIQNTNESYPLVVNSGALTIENVAIEASKSDRAIWLRNSGTVLNFNSGSLLATKGENNSYSKIYGVWVCQGATANINGGTITVDAGADATAVAIFGNYVNTVNITGGKISTSGKNYSYAVWTDGDVTVTGGEIVTNEKKYGYSSGITYGKNYAITTTGDVTISGGKITTNGPSGYLVNSTGTANQTVTISDVEFTNVLSEADRTAGGHSEPNLIYGSSITAEITGGEFNGVSAALIKGTGSTLTVSGGSFSAIDEDYVETGATVTVAGQKMTKTEEGTLEVVAPKGNDFSGYTRGDAIWGEVWGNASESFVIKVLDADGNVMGTTSLNNIGGIIDGDVNVTWSILLDAASNTDEYWTMQWTTAPSLTTQPAKVELWVDGVKVSGGNVVLNAPDDLNKIYAAVADENGKITGYYTTVSAAAEAAVSGQTVQLLRDTTETVKLGEGVTLDKNGHTAGNVTETVCVAYIGTKGYETVQAAINAAKDGETVKITAGEFGAINISNKNITIQGTVGANGELLTTIKGGNPAITGHGFNGTIKDLKIVDAWKVMYAEPAGNVTVDNVYVTGATYGLHLVAYSTGLTWTIQDSYMDLAWANSFGVYGTGDAAIIIKGNTFESTNPYYEDYGAIHVNSFLPNVTVEENIFGKNAKIYIDKSVTDTSNINISKNYHEDGVENAFADDSDGVKVGIYQYYTEVNADGTLTGLVDARVAQIGDVKYNTLQEALNAAAAATGNVTVEILADIDLTGTTWTPVTVSAPGYPMVTVNGNDKTITGLSDMLFAGTWAGKSGLVINDLTIKDSTIVHDENDTMGNVGVGAFIGFPQASATITLNNCHLVNSTVNGGHWTGGLIGYAAGYAGTDGPVFMNLTIKDCSVTGSTITGKGSVGGVIGHATGNGWTKVAIETTTVSGNTVTSTGSSTNKAGAVVGTIGAAGKTTTVNGVEKTGGVAVSATVSGNTVTSNGTTITTVYGRQGTDTGKLEISGGTYDKYPIEEHVSYAAPTEGYVIEENADGTYGLEVDPAYGKAAKIGDTYYTTLAEAVAAAKAGDEIVLLADVAENVTVPAGVIFNGNGKQVGNITAAGEITFKGHTKATNFGVQYTNTTINIGEGACLEITGSGRLVIGHGCTFNITGTITDAKTADKAAIQPSLIMPGASFTGAGVTFNVTNAYIKVPSSYCSSSSSASGTFDFNIENSIWESAGKLAFEAQSTAATVNFELKNSVLTTGSHLVFGVAAGEVIIDNSNVNVGTSRQIENRSTLTIKNGSVVNGAVATSSNAINPGTLIVENATYAVTGQFSGSTVGTGTLIIKKGATVSVGSIVDKANIQIDATGMAAGDEVNFTANLSKFAGTLEVVNNGALEAKIVDGKVVLVAKPVAKIGEVSYTSLVEAFKAATDGCTIEILSDVTISEKWDCRDYATNGSHSQFKESVTINGNDHTIKFTGTINDNNWNTVFRFEENATVKNLTVDISEATGAQRVISAKKSLTVDGLTIIGTAKYGVIFGEGASADDLAATEIVIQNSTLTGTRRAISDNEGGKDVKSVVITGNTLNANVYVSASESITFNNNTAAGEVDLRSYAAENVLSVEAQGNTLTAAVKNYIYAKTIDAQAEFTAERPAFKVATKAELDAALAAAQDGDTIILTADIDYGVNSLTIDKPIILDLGGKTLTTRWAHGGMFVKNNPTIKNGTIVHASNTAAIKVWNATAFEDLVIDVQGKGDANKTIGGIVLQSGSTTRVGSIKNVTIKGDALTNGIETYNCGDATENVIGSMENVTIAAKGTGMLISAPCGTATNCSISGGTNGIEIWIKGTYSASLDLVDSTVVGGVFAHDEFNSNPSIVNNGTLKLTVDDATTGVEVEDITLTINHAEESQVKGEALETIINTAQAKVNGTYYETIAKAIEAAQPGDTVTILAGNYTTNISVNKAITVVGETDAEGNNLVNITGKLNITADGAAVKNLNVNNGSSSAGYINAKDVLVEGCTVVGGNGFRSCYTDGTVTFKDSTITGATYGIHFDGSAGGNIVIDNCVITGWTSFAASIKKVTMTGTTFEEGNYNYVRFYQEEVVIAGCTFNEKMAVDLAVDGATATVTNSTVENGSVEDLFSGADMVNSTITVDGEKLTRVAKVGNTYYETLTEALAELQANGGTLELLADASINASVVVLKDTVINGNGKKLTVTGAYGIDVKAGVNLAINNLTVESNLYALNLRGASDNAQVTITDSNLTGCIALNVWGKNVVVNATNSEFVSVDKAAAENYSAIALNNNGTNSAENTVINITGGKITALDENGAPSVAIRNATATGVANVSDTTVVTGEISEVVAIVTYNGYDAFYSYFTLETAIERAENDPNATVKLLKDITISEKLVIEGNVTIDGNGKTITYTGTDRAIDVPKTANNANVTIKNLTLAFTGGYSQRGINYNTNGTLILDNVTVNGDDVTYAVNLPSSSANATVEITNSSITGRIALNVWGPNAAVTATNSHFTSVDPTSVENYAAVKLNNNGTDSAEGATITINGGSITAKDENGNPSSATTNATATGVITISDTTVVIGNHEKNVAAVLYSGASEFYGCFTLQEAVEKAANDPKATVKLLRDITESVTITGTVVLDLNGKTISGEIKLTTTDSVVNSDGGLNVTTDIADHKVVFENGQYKVVAKEYVAEVNGTKYESLQEAVNVGGTVTVLTDVTLTETLKITKPVTLELNGKTVSYTTTESKGESMITNRGDLTIQDSVDGGKLSYAYTGAADSSYGYGNQTIENFGTLTLVSGTVENTSDAMSHASYAINNREGATLNIKGGKVLNLNAHAIRQTSFGTAANTVNISGGYVEGTRAIQFQLPGSAGAAAAEMTLNISGGELKSNEATYNLALYVYSNGQSAEKVKINITGGTFNGNVAINAAATDTMADKAVSVTDGVFNGEYGVFSYADDEVAKPVISLTGGTYKTDYSEIYAQDDGYVFKQNADGTYGLTEAPAAFHDANKNGTLDADETVFQTVAQALAAANSGDVVVMNADSDETGTTLVIMKGVTLDLNGHDLTADGLVAFKGNYLIDSANSRVSSADTGALIVPKGNLSLPEDNAELPFWTGSEYALLDPNTSTASGYQGVKIPTDNGFRFEFRPGFGYIDGKSVRSNYLLNGGADNEIQMILRMSWTNSRGQVVVQDFEYTDEMFTEAYQSGNIFYLNVRGTANLGEITITAVVVSDTGVEFIGESCVYNSADYATGE